MPHASLLALLGALALGPLLVPCADRGGQGAPPADRTPKRAPLLVVDRTGGTLLGPAHMHLLVYDDGHVAYVSRSRAPGDEHDLTRRLAPPVVKALHARLLAARALELSDQATGATDVPLTTVTVLEGPPTFRAHTFSYWIPTEGFEPVDRALADFVEEHLLAEPGSAPGDR